MNRPPVLMIVLTVVVMLTACGGARISSASPTASKGASPKVVGTVTQTKSDCSLSTVAGPISAGTLRLKFVNETGIFAAFDVFEIPQGHTYAEAEEFIREERRLAEAGQPGIPHTAFFTAIDPIDHVLVEVGQSSTVAGEFQAGTHAIVCLRRFEQVNDIRPFATAGPLTVGWRGGPSL